MQLPFFQIDAFTGKIFSGNPAAVVPLEKWLPDSILQSIARENNLSETAFFVSDNGSYRLRWFTPQVEVDLCGHATLAAAFVIFREMDRKAKQITFHTKSGPLTVTRKDALLTMDFPAQPPVGCRAPEALLKAFGKNPIEILRAEDYLVVFASERDIRELTPDPSLLKTLDLRGVIVTAKGDNADFVSRFFAPLVGIDEDPVTGSAHCTLTPYWSGKLNKKHLHAFQISERGGELFCENRGDRVLISGQAVKYLEGRIHI